MKTESLESRIREKAARELKDEIHEATNPLRDKLAIGYSLDVTVPNANGPYKVRAHHLIEYIEETLFNHFKNTREEEAIDAFLKKVDSLQDQIDELANLRQQ